VSPSDATGARGPAPDWFTRPSGGAPGTLNLAYNALDRHVVRGLADEQALLHPFAAPGVRSSYSYAELLERVAQLGGGLRELGVRPGRAVVLALPLVPELVIGLLACARVGAVAVPVVDEAPGAVRRLGRADVDRPAVVVVDAARKAAVDEVLAAAGRAADYQVVLRPDPGTLDASVGDVDLAVVMRPGSFEPAACAELPADSPFLLRLPDGDEAATGAAPATYDHAWTLDLSAQAVGAGWGPGSYVAPADDPSDATPYGALLGPLLVGATVELR
jgi:acyl-CoA synthetase (AMP-forming)/AMP-acid ligase II